MEPRARQTFTEHWCTRRQAWQSGGRGGARHVRPPRGQRSAGTRHAALAGGREGAGGRRADGLASKSGDPGLPQCLTPKGSAVAAPPAGRFLRAGAAAALGAPGRGVVPTAQPPGRFSAAPLYRRGKVRLREGCDTAQEKGEPSRTHEVCCQNGPFAITPRAQT